MRDIVKKKLPKAKENCMLEPKIKKGTNMKIIYCGDVVGRSGRETVFNNIPEIKKQFRPDVIIVNGENAAHGFGITPGICRDFFEAGVDAVVTGNHVWNQKDILPFFNECRKLVRPLNYPAGTPGRGFCEIELASGKKILITQVMGRAFMEALDCPVQALENLLKNYRLGGNVAAIFVDIHAEATAEKQALGHYLDGRVSIVAGTHTHVPTSDARILPKGTAYITDVGMCGDYDSVLGFEKEAPIARLLHKYPSEKLIPSKGVGTLYGIFVETDNQTGLATRIEQIKF